MRELADIVRISKGVLHCILTENWDIKLYARWVSRLLTIEQKQRREDILIKCSPQCYESTQFVRRFITPETK